MKSQSIIYVKKIMIFNCNSKIELTSQRWKIGSFKPVSTTFLLPNLIVKHYPKLT